MTHFDFIPANGDLLGGAGVVILNGDGVLNGKDATVIVESVGTSSTPTLDSIQFDINYTPATPNEGLLHYNNLEKCLEYGETNGGSLQIGQEMRMYAKNKQGSSISQGQAVYIFGAAGNNVEMKLADADVYNEACCTIAIATEDILHDTSGRFTTFGFVRTLNTDSWEEGDMLWLSATPGNLTNVKPTYPSNIVRTGIVTRKNANNGEIFVTIALDKQKFGDVTGGNYSEFKDDGTYRAHGDATVYNDLIIQGLGLRSGGTAPTFAIFQNGVYANRFAKGDEAHGSVEIQHDYEEGTTMEVHVHWSPSSTNTGNVAWGYEYTIANRLGIFGTTATLLSTPVAASGAINTHEYTTIGTIVGTNRKIGDLICFRVYRVKDTTDTFTGNCFVHSIGVHYKCNSLGSQSPASK